MIKSNYNKLSARNKASWKCPDCKVPLPKTDDTPVKETNVDTTVSPSYHSSTELNNSLQEFENRLMNRLDGMLQKSQLGIKMEIESLRKEMHILPDLKQAVDFMSEKYDIMYEELTSLRSLSSSLQAENSRILNDVKELKLKVQQMEQYSRDCNIEIQCLPEHKQENLVNTVQQLAKIVSCPLEEKDIQQCTRVAKKDNQSSRPRATILKLSTPRLRDCLLAAVLTFNKNKPKEEKLNTAHLGIGGDKSPVYVSEHLSPYNRSLHAEARKIKRDKGYKYLWIRNGRVLIRKDDSSPSTWIKDSDTLSGL
ncbi:unnamed protein product [Plutella xylostella]|uniref:(diamondback moth) hypothetical protein n=1 Tax=Plutella xylostella TaxID=51655 RepID=A0A8S4E9B1_PLUXY|nr:unnamed protein product [Plutella xylostella]